MLIINALLEYLSSPEGNKRIILSIAITGAINFIFIRFSLRLVYAK